MQRDGTLRIARAPAFIESFNGRLRDELLNETLFTSLVPLHHRANRAQMMPGLSSSADEPRGSAHLRCHGILGAKFRDFRCHV